MERQEYANPPIEEALCQFNFAEMVPWNVATPGLLYERLRKIYSNEPEMQEQVTAAIGTEPGQSTANLSLNRGPSRILYRGDPPDKLVVLSRETISANSLRPYEGWPSLRERLDKAMSAVNEQLGSPLINRVSLRYINKIVIPSGHPVDTDAYFNLPVRTVQQGSAYLQGFIHRVESLLKDECTRAVSIFMTAPGQVPTFVLDLDFHRALDEPVAPSEALQIADELHELENAEFNSCITSLAKKLFD